MARLSSAHSSLPLPAAETEHHTSLLRGLPRQAGVYQMLDEEGRILYVGKAGNLRQRVSSYFRPGALNARLLHLRQRIRRVDLTVTPSETDALLLEQNLIKEQCPPYNVMLRDDKSYPYIHLSTQQEYPRMTFYRGSRRGAGRYFGPFPGVQALRENLNFLHKTFQIRQCRDSYFRNRTRPCLQYQIGRCSAPCTGEISPEEYRQAVQHAILFLEGKDQEVSRQLADCMEQAAAREDYEAAARYRDCIAKLRHLQERQNVEYLQVQADVVASVEKEGRYCIHRLQIRAGRIINSRSFFPSPGALEEEARVLEEFLAQLYLNAPAAEVPGEILVAPAPTRCALLERALRRHSGHAVRISHQARGARARWLQLAGETARGNLHNLLASQSNSGRCLAALAQLLQLPQLPRRLECFDVSHTQGEATVASCVVFDDQGPLRQAYRRFNIRGVTPGDDPAALQQALRRRYQRVVEEDGVLPEVILIDGGKPQLRVAQEVLRQLLSAPPVLLAVAKGASRRPGRETLYLAGKPQGVMLSSRAPALQLVQQLRDEAHRFAILGHRRQRARARSVSPLEGVPNVGAVRRRELLRFFGGLQGIRRAGVEELRRAPGIGPQTAQALYEALHEQCA